MTDDTLTPDELWAVARDAYLSGATATTVCRDLGLPPSTFFKRAAREGWLRRDQAVRTPPPLDLDGPVDDFATAADKAWRRAVQAIDQGRSTEAQRWMRMHEALAANVRSAETMPDWRVERARAATPRAGARHEAPRAGALDTLFPSPVEKVESIFSDSTLDFPDPLPGSALLKASVSSLALTAQAASAIRPPS